MNRRVAVSGASLALLLCPVAAAANDAPAAATAPEPVPLPGDGAIGMIVGFAAGGALAWVLARRDDAR